MIIFEKKLELLDKAISRYRSWERPASEDVSNDLSRCMLMKGFIRLISHDNFITEQTSFLKVILGDLLRAEFQNCI